MKLSAILTIESLLIAAFASAVSAAEYGDESPESEFKFNSASDMSKMYPERASVHALSHVKNERTKIPEELQRMIYGFAHVSASNLQRRIIIFIEGYIESHLKTREWNGIRIEYQFQRNRIAIGHSDIQNPRTLRLIQDFEGKMTQMERDCMNQMLLKRNPLLTIQKTVGKILYSYTMDGADGRPSYIDPTVKNYCHSNASHGEYKYNAFPGNKDYEALTEHVQAPTFDPNIINLVGEGGVPCNFWFRVEAFKKSWASVGKDETELGIIDFEICFKGKEETGYRSDAVEVHISYKYPRGAKENRFAIRADVYGKWHYAMRGSLMNYGDFTVIKESDDSMTFRWIRNTLADSEVD